jgi:hypothetical protein
VTSMVRSISANRVHGTKPSLAKQCRHLGRLSLSSLCYCFCQVAYGIHRQSRVRRGNKLGKTRLGAAEAAPRDASDQPTLLRLQAEALPRSCSMS